jgi:serine/threonine-protein kinase
VSDKAAAEALFDQGLKLMKEKKYAEACPKLEESQRIDAGIGTLLYLAECYEKSGRTASAWATFREAASAASAAGQAERALQGKERADKLDGSLSMLTILVAPENKGIADFQVTRAGQVVQAPLFDTAVPVDPGELLIEASAPGYKPLSKTATVAANGARAVVEIPPLVPDETQPTTAPTPAQAPAPAGPSAPGETSTSQGTGFSADSSASDGSGMRTVGVVIMGVGAASIAIGSVFGVSAINKDADADDLCEESSCRSDRGAQLSQDATKAATISTIGFAVGGAALLGGAILYLSAPDGSETAQLRMTPVAGGAHMSFQGRF